MRFFMTVKVFAPMSEKSSLIFVLIAWIDVRIPTRAMIPIAMIMTVRTVLERWLPIALRATRTFSLAVRFNEPGLRFDPKGKGSKLFCNDPSRSGTWIA